MIEIPAGLYAEMTEHARAGLPNEACGVLAGEDGRPIRVYRMRNAEESPLVYRFDGREQLQVENEIEEKGWNVLAVFHSHTHTDAYPSMTDRARAYWPDPENGDLIYPGARYLILSLAEEQPVIRAYRFEAGEPVEEDVRVS